MRRLIPALCLLLLAAGGDLKPAIERLRAHRQDGMLIVSFELTEVFDEPTVERLESGLPLEFRYVVRLEHPRRMWFDRGLGRTTLDIIATYNAVTGEYLVNRKQDDKLIDSRAVTSTEDLQRAMTMVSSLSAFEIAKPPGERTFVRVRAELGRRNLLLLFRRTITTGWARVRLDRPE
jgi:hypothetical protein